MLVINKTMIEIAFPVLLSFFISVILSPIIIPFLHKLKFGQCVRTEGPQAHLKKAGTPTMGGVIFLISVVLTSLCFVKGNTDLIPVLFVTLGFGLVGFLDDYLKVVRKNTDGLLPWQKMLGQFIVTVAFTYILITNDKLGTATYVPFYGEITLPLPVFVVMLFFVFLGTVNGVNFTDGLDGLASSVTVVVATFFTVVAVGTQSGIAPVTCAVVGSLLGFLLFNVYPAKVFMGDTGSLALGGFVAASAYMLKMPLFIPLIGLIYLCEVLSVMLQVTYFKYTKKKYGEGKRIFRMTPIHHHYELGGWSETRVVAVFSCVTALLCLIALTAMQ